MDYRQPMVSRTSNLREAQSSGKEERSLSTPYVQRNIGDSLNVRVSPMSYRTGWRWKPSVGREAVRAMVRGLVPKEWKEQASARVSMGGADENKTKGFKILREKEPIQVAVEQHWMNERVRNGLGK